MATSNFAHLLLLAFALLAASAAARPCKTLFFITSTSYYHQIPNFIPQNPNPNFPQFRTFFLTNSPDSTRFRLFRPSIRVFFDRRPDPILIRRSDTVEEAAEQVVDDGEGFYSSVTNSIRDRTKDIMRVVGALLFGVGCGALTAATMYLIWSLFWANRYDFEDSDNDDFDYENGDSAAKKLGYVSIPSKVADDDLKKPTVAPAPAPAKEV